jgi:osmotically-inducible protein OsmY
MMTSDTDLQQTIRRVLSEAPNIDQSGLQIQAREGVVTLAGTVTSELDHWQIADMIRRIADVLQVVNATLVVSNTAADVPDGDIAKPW